MRIRHSTRRGLQPCGLLAVPLHANGDRDEIEELDRATGGRLRAELHARSLDPTREGHVYLYQSHGELPADLIAVVGFGRGDPTTRADAWRRFAGRAIGAALAQRVQDVMLSVASAGVDEALAAAGATIEGALLAGYRIEGFRSSSSAPRVERCTVIGVPSSAGMREVERRAVAVAEATCFARDLINGPASEITPAYLGHVAQRLAQTLPWSVRVFGPSQLRRLGMGAILAVGRGSRNAPRLIEIVYRPHGVRDAVAIVGKGICFDSGGLSLKPAGSMEIQKRDMAGGAAVLGAMRAIAQIAPQIEVRGYIAAAENMPGGNAYRPGDVLRTYSGKTVEVLNTDAEGRLVLADALSYAARGRGGRVPRWMIDIATLTGAVTTALGRGYAAVMGTDAGLVRRIIETGLRTGEPVWELPLVDEYTEAMKSLIADIKNTGDGTAGSIFGGLFLREFVGGVPWAHLDIASVAYGDKAKPYVPRGAVGWGVRTLVDLVEQSGIEGESVPVGSIVKRRRGVPAPPPRSAGRRSKGSRRRRA